MRDAGRRVPTDRETVAVAQVDVAHVRAARRDHRAGDRNEALEPCRDVLPAEADAGNFKTATAIWEEMRPSIVTTMTPPALGTDARLIVIRLRAGDVEVR